MFSDFPPQLSRYLEKISSPLSALYWGTERRKSVWEFTNKGQSCNARVRIQHPRSLLCVPWSGFLPYYNYNGSREWPRNMILHHEMCPEGTMLIGRGSSAFSSGPPSTPTLFLSVSITYILSNIVSNKLSLSFSGEEVLHFHFHFIVSIILWKALVFANDYNLKYTEMHDPTLRFFVEGGKNETFYADFNSRCKSVWIGFLWNLEHCCLNTSSLRPFKKQ